MSTKVLTLKCRFSYVHVFEPQASQDGGEPKYGLTLLIPKSDTITLGKIKAAIAEAAENFRAKNGASSLPANPLLPIHDGDGDKPNGGSYGPECAGHWVLACSSKQKPLVVDECGVEISGPRTECKDPNAVYSGCYGRAEINFYGYNNRRKGIGCGLLGIKKLHDGEPLGGSFASASDFEDGWIDPEMRVTADDDLLF